MANGQEDLIEKNKGGIAELKQKKSHQFSDWKNFQGREDAEMLQEKSVLWSAGKSSRGDYDGWDEE